MNPVAARSVALLDTDLPRPVVAGTRIKVSQIAAEHVQLGMSPEHIVHSHPHLTLAQVHAALDFYREFSERIRAEWTAADELVARIREQHPGRLSG